MKDILEVIAKYECCNCFYKYEATPGPQPTCPRCGSLYMKWTNYNEVNKRYFHN
ncbi:MAG: hypothetical protein ACTSPQ_18485 [Candidatus Helarchaeota archaeon]